MSEPSTMQVDEPVHAAAVRRESVRTEPERPKTMRLASLVAGSARSAAATSPAHVVAVLDPDARWKDGAPPDQRVVTVAPGRGLAARLAARAPEQILVNLAVPGAIESMTALR